MLSRNNIFRKQLTICDKLTLNTLFFEQITSDNLWSVGTKGRASGLSDAGVEVETVFPSAVGVFHHLLFAIGCRLIVHQIRGLY